MSHMCGRMPSSRDKASKVFYKKIKPAYDEALSTKRVSTDCKCVKCSKSDCQHKMKRLRTRKERNQIRDGVKEASTAKSSHDSSCQSSKHTSEVHQCCHNPFVADTFKNTVPTMHEYSVITDSRLIGHHGLFNHEVKSIDIERLLSEQRKLDRSGQLEKITTDSLHLSAFVSSSPNQARHLSHSTNNEAKDQSSKTFHNSQDNKVQLSDLTPGQRPKKTLNSSIELSNESLTHSSPGVRDVQPSLCQDKESHQTPSGAKENDMNNLQGPEPSIIEHTPQNLASASNPTQVSHLRPLQPSSPPTAGASNCTDIQQASLNTDSVAMSVKAVAASLCNSISFSLLRKRNLVEENRQVLVKALQQRHGGQLQANILEVQRRLYSHCHVQREVSELSQSPIFRDKDGPFGAEFTPFEASSFASSSLEKKRRRQFNWNTSDWSNPFEETAACLGSPAKNPVGLDGTFSCRCSPQFCLEFDFQNEFSREREPWLPLLSPSSHIDDPRSPGHVITESTKTFLNLPDKGTMRHSRSPLTSFSNNHSCFVTHHPASESVHFPLAHSSFETYKSFSNEIPCFEQESSFEPALSHFSYPSTSPALRPQQADLAHYPPSYRLEKGPTLSACSFPSPEHWSFPPMRLY